MAFTASFSTCLPMEVNVKDIASRISDSEDGPMLNLGVLLKVPISELLSAIASLQPRSQVPGARQYTHGSSSSFVPLVSAPWEPVPAVTSLYPHACAAEEATVSQSTGSTQPPAVTFSQSTEATVSQSCEPKIVEITWDTPIMEILSHGHQEYVKKSMWEIPEDGRARILAEQMSLLEDVIPTQLKAPEKIPKAPSQPYEGIFDVRAQELIADALRTVAMEAGMVSEEEDALTPVLSTSVDSSLPTAYVVESDSQVALTVGDGGSGVTSLRHDGGCSASASGPSQEVEGASVGSASQPQQKKDGKECKQQ